MSKLADLEKRLAALHAKTEAGFGERARELREAAAKLDAGEEGAGDEIKRLAHKLRGIAGSAGHPKLTERAGRLESAISSGASALAVAEGARRLAAAAEEAGEGKANKPARDEGAKPAASGRPRLGWFVVAIDDEASTRRLLEITLKTAGGCEANVVEDPGDAVRAIGENETDLVIVDAMMPEMDGLTFYRGVRQKFGAALPVVILSAASAEELGWELPEDPLLRWMRKPFRPASLIAELRAFVEEATG